VPGQKDSKIKCILQQASFASPPPYEALSYTWGNPKSRYNKVPAKGDPSKTYRIKVGTKQVKITCNLEAALQKIRHETESRTLWVDALCINQADVEERNKQVKSMARIYSQATKMLVWLGEDDKYMDLAYDTLEELCWASKVFAWKYCSEKLDIPLAEVSNSELASLINSELSDHIQKCTSPF
jgi:hypothetical protein